jgi:hypothetical protein
MSFFLNHFRYRQVAEFFAHANELVNHGFELTEGLDLLPIERHQLGVGQAQGESFATLLAGDQGIGAAPDDGAVGVFDLQELLRKRAPTQLPQAGQLFEEGLAPMFQV